MADNYIRLQDTISSHEGKGFITIDGQNRELFEISKISAQLDFVVQERRMLGHRMTQHKVVGVTGSGSATFYFMNSDLLKQAISYIKNGGYNTLKLQIYNEDEQSTVGKQEVVLSGVILNTVLAAYLDDQSDDPITFDSDFTFDNIENLEEFNLPENYR